MSRFGRVILLLGVAVALVSAAASAEPPVFYITRVIVPPAIVANGASRPLTVDWGGHPEWPVTLLAIAKTCRRGVVCPPVEYTFTAYRFPLTVGGSRCEGKVPAKGAKLSYMVWLQYSHGNVTAKFAKVVACRR